MFGLWITTLIGWRPIERRFPEGKPASVPETEKGGDPITGTWPIGWSDPAERVRNHRGRAPGRPDYADAQPSSGLRTTHVCGRVLPTSLPGTYKALGPCRMDVSAEQGQSFAVSSWGWKRSIR